MKKHLLKLTFLSAILISSCGEKSQEDKKEEVKAPEPVTYTVNTAETSLEWHGYQEAKHEHEHWGHINVADGTITVLEGEITDGNFVIDMNSMVVPNMEDSMSIKLIGHLKSPQFFNTEQFANSTFNLTGVENGTAKGKLTVLGISTEIEFPVNVEITEDKITATGEFSLDFSSFGIPMLGVSEQMPPEEAFSETLDFKLNLIANKQ